MSDVATIPPPLRSDLRLAPIGSKGKYVIKDPKSGDYYHFGEQEYFLLTQLDGKQTSEVIRTRFSERFGELLTEDDFRDFVALARTQCFLKPAPAAVASSITADPNASSDDATQRREKEGAKSNGAVTSPGATVDKVVDKDSGRQARAPRAESVRDRRLSRNPLFWRKRLFNPDALLDWLQPRVWFLWTPAFVAASFGLMLLAAAVALLNGPQLVTYFANAIRWETLVWVYVTMIAVTACHEFAHGLTCKRYGGEVREMGFLLIFLMPAFYCDVSDAWLFREKSKRVWVTLAGAYCEVCIGALAVLVWRLTVQDSLINYLAWVVLSVAGVRVLFNFNPLLKLDGYYLLSDLVEIPNLRQEAMAHAAGHLRWLLWGAPRPQPKKKGAFLLCFGVACWLFSVVFLTAILLAIGGMLWSRLGIVGAGLGVATALMVLPYLFRGSSSGEVKNMLIARHKRTAVWVMALGAVPIGLIVPQMEDFVGGTFQARPVRHAEIRAPVASFLEQVYFDEGDSVTSGTRLAQLDVLDLSSQLSRKRAEVKEAEANLHLLEIGSRPEAITEQRQRVARAEEWRELAVDDLQQAKQALEAELTRIEKQITECRAELAYAQTNYERSRELRRKGVLPQEKYQEAEKSLRVCQARLDQAAAELRSRKSLGTVEAEEELARREEQLSEANSELRLLEAGTRPEELEAERARLMRLMEETDYLERLQQKLSLDSPIEGVIATPHLADKVGHYFKEGDLICEIHDPSTLEVEVALAEEDAARIEAGQRVELKARALPFDNFETRVAKVAPVAEAGDLQSTVTVYCQFDATETAIRPGMTGYARIYTGRRAIGKIALDRLLRYLRTEFWW